MTILFLPPAVACAYLKVKVYRLSHSDGAIVIDMTSRQRLHVRSHSWDIVAVTLRSEFKLVSVPWRTYGGLISLSI